jgi:hypothetical protein
MATRRVFPIQRPFGDYEMDVPDKLIQPDTFDFLSAPHEQTRITLDLPSAKIDALRAKIQAWESIPGREATEMKHPLFNGPEGNDMQNAVLFDVYKSLADPEHHQTMVDGQLGRVHLQLRDFTKELIFLHVLYTKFGPHVLDTMKVLDPVQPHQLDGDSELQNDVLEVVYRRAARDWYDPWLYRCLCQQVAHEAGHPEAVDNPKVRQNATRLYERKGWGPTEAERLE